MVVYVLIKLRVAVRSAGRYRIDRACLFSPRLILSRHLGILPKHTISAHFQKENNTTTEREKKKCEACEWTGGTCRRMTGTEPGWLVNLPSCPGGPSSEDGGLGRGAGHDRDCARVLGRRTAAQARPTWRLAQQGGDAPHVPRRTELHPRRYPPCPGPDPHTSFCLVRVARLSVALQHQRF